MTAEEEEEDKQQLKSLKKSEANLLVEVGIPADLIYEKNKEDEEEVSFNLTLTDE